MQNRSFRLSDGLDHFRLSGFLVGCVLCSGWMMLWACGDAQPPIGDIDSTAEVSPCCQLDSGEGGGTGLEDVAQDAPTAAVTLPADAIRVVGTACCLSVAADGLLWSADGAIYEYRWATGSTRMVVFGPGEQTDPVGDGDWLAWTDTRTGDRDVWVSHVPTGTMRVFAGGPGDQHSPDLSDGWLTWVSSDEAPYGPQQAEIWAAKLDDEAVKFQLTDDDVEQSWPQISGNRVVFTDFSNDPDKRYIPGLFPDQNNGDIRGVDLSTRLIFDVIVDPAKQIRPALDGDVVSWLDWRGITPEPKFVSLQVAVKNLATGEEKLLATTSWPGPDWWVRPAVFGNHVAWVGSLDAGNLLWLRVADSSGAVANIAQVGWPMGGIVLISGHVGWLSDGNITILPLSGSM